MVNRPSWKKTNEDWDWAVTIWERMAQGDRDAQIVDWLVTKDHHLDRKTLRLVRQELRDLPPELAGKLSEGLQRYKRELNAEVESEGQVAVAENAPPESGDNDVIGAADGAQVHSPVTDQEASTEGTPVRGQADHLTKKLEAENGKRYEDVGLYARRLRRIVCQMWLPEPENVPLDRVPGVGFYEEDAGGTLFRWEQQSDGCLISWVDADTERWLDQEFLPLLGDALAREIAEEWQGLQEDMNRYLRAADGYQFALRERIGEHLPLDTVRFASPATSALPEDRVDIKEARFLIEEFPRLRGRVALMRDRLDDALASLGDSNT